MILVTGGTGFIGKHVRDYFPSNTIFIEREDYVTGSPIENALSRNGLKIEDSVDITILHLAGTAHGKSNTCNKLFNFDYLETINLVKESLHLKIKRFVYFSTVNIFGTSTSTEPIGFKTELFPTDSKSVVCSIIENRIRELTDESLIQLFIVRAPLVYGYNAPGNFGQLVTLVRKFPILPFGNIKNRRSFVSILNLCDFLLVCCESGQVANGEFNVSDGHPISTTDFVNHIALGLGLTRMNLPVPVCCFQILGRVFNMERTASSLVDNFEVSDEAIVQSLGWTPPFTIQETMKMLREGSNV